MADSNPPHSSGSDHPPAPPSTLIEYTFTPIRIANSVMNFLPHVPTTCYDTLHRLFFDFGFKFLDTPSFELATLLLMKDSPAAVQELKKLLPTAASPCSFHDSIRDRLYDDTETYMLWLECLKSFEFRKISFPHFKQLVEPLFFNMPDLWNEFESFGYVQGDPTKPAAAEDIAKSIHFQR